MGRQFSSTIRCNQKGWMGCQISINEVLLIFNFCIMFVFASNPGDTAISSKCNHLNRTAGQRNAYVASHGEVCCMCWKGTYLAGDCKVGSPSTTACHDCDRTVRKTYIDFEPHMEKNCKEDAMNCQNSMVAIGGTASSKSRCNCPPGTKRFEKHFCIPETILSTASSSQFMVNTSIFAITNVANYGEALSTTMNLSVNSVESNSNSIGRLITRYTMITVGAVGIVCVVAFGGVQLKTQLRKLRRRFNDFTWKSQTQSSTPHEDVEMGLLRPRTGFQSETSTATECWKEKQPLPNEASAIHARSNNEQPVAQHLVNTEHPVSDRDMDGGLRWGHLSRVRHDELCCNEISESHKTRRTAAFEKISEIIKPNEAHYLAQKLLGDTQRFGDIYNEWRNYTPSFILKVFQVQVQDKPTFCLHNLYDVIKHMGDLARIVSEEIRSMETTQV